MISSKKPIHTWHPIISEVSHVFQSSSKLALEISALEAFEKVLKLDPKDDEAWYMKARCLSQMKRKVEAAKALFVAKSINPKLKQSRPKERLRFRAY